MENIGEKKINKLQNTQSSDVPELGYLTKLNAVIRLKVLKC